MTWLPLWRGDVTAFPRIIFSVAFWLFKLSMSEAEEEGDSPEEKKLLTTSTTKVEHRFMVCLIWEFYKCIR